MTHSHVTPYSTDTHTYTPTSPRSSSENVTADLKHVFKRKFQKSHNALQQDTRGIRAGGGDPEHLTNQIWNSETTNYHINSRVQCGYLFSN